MVYIKSYCHIKREKKKPYTVGYYEHLTVKIQGPFSSYLSSMHPDSTIFETKKRDEKACTKQTMDQNQSPTRIGYVTGSQPKGRDYYFDSFKNTLFK